ncbi:hypothetical protein N425_08635 [Tannerella sp. oral taxon BU063 isolate Cell 2]|uniref:Uncharacterized protein n=1 Tax=Tannerella sp. oral taxon BU063 isolate Cell 2 TaxID=1411148 RepID=W2C5J3_9BACT|nr:hypothetical protein N425_08635 [Tannerella sp. oral taxon BU063 isolate Cell 2]
MAKVFLEMLAEVPQIKKRTLWRLRDSRKSKRERFGVCGTPANQKKNVLALAEVPQIKKRTLWRLRDSRKSKKERFGVCGSSANQKENALAFAEVPQIKKRTFWRLRKFRKSKREHFGVCGTPANQKKNVLALAGFPQIEKRMFWRLRKFRGAFPKTLWSLQRSIQAILQGLGASFFRSSSRCKDFWKGRSAAEGIRFAPIDRWEAIGSCDLYLKCRSDPATHFRPRWTGHRIASGFSPFQTAPTFAALKT